MNPLLQRLSLTIKTVASKMSQNDLGKLRKRTGKPCPACGEKSLEIRMYGDKERVVCPNCDYEASNQVKRVRRQEEEEEQIVEPRRNIRPMIRHI